MVNIKLKQTLDKVKCWAIITAALIAVEGLAQSSSVTRDQSAVFNGRQLEVQSCRVSAIPFNRVWPGYQRSPDQTKEAYFVAFDVDQPGSFEWRLPVGAEKVRVRPFSRAQGSVVKNVFSTRIDHPENFVIETATTEYHVFVQKPWRYVPRVGDRYFAPGVHQIGCIMPKSGERIVLDRGAIVYGNFVMLGVTNVTIEGRGILDTSRLPRVDENYPGVKAARAFGLSSTQSQWGMAPIFAQRCANLSISGLVFRDSPRWTMNIVDSSQVLIDDVKLVGMWRYNADGIDICACSHVIVRNSFVRSFDDCVISRPQQSMNENTPMKDMMVSNCVLWCDWGYNMKVQHAQRACAMSDIHFKDIDCAYLQSGGVIVTTRWGSDGSVIENVSFDDIRYHFASGALASCYQTTDDTPFVPKNQDRLCLINIGAYSLGRVAPNQGKPGKMDPNFFRLDYHDIAFSRFTVYDAPLHQSANATNCYIHTVTDIVPHFTLRNITFRDMPPGVTCPKGMMK